MKELAPGGVDPFVGVCTEVIALGLQQVGRQAAAAIAVVKVEGRGHSRHGNSQLDSLGGYPAPGGLGIFDKLPEVVVQQQIRQVGSALEGLFYIAQEDTADNAAFAPHHGYFTIIKLPVVLTGSLTHQHKTLGVGDYL